MNKYEMRFALRILEEADCQVANVGFFYDEDWKPGQLVTAISVRLGTPITVYKLQKVIDIIMKVSSFDLDKLMGFENESKPLFGGDDTIASLPKDVHIAVVDNVLVVKRMARLRSPSGGAGR